MIETERTLKKTGKTSRERRFFISSLGVDPKKALRVAVSHWDIENPLHWTLDMVFDEDHSLARFGHAAENLAIMRHFAFDMIRCDKVTDGPVRFAECFSGQQSANSNQQKGLKRPLTLAAERWLLAA